MRSPPLSQMTIYSEKEAGRQEQSKKDREAGRGHSYRVVKEGFAANVTWLCNNYYHYHSSGRRCK